MAARDRTSASAYPYPLTHVIGIIYFLSAGAAAGILCYFIYYLRQDNTSVPLQLIIPLVAALLSLVSLVYAFVVHTFGSASAKTHVSINVVLFILWTVSLGIVGWKLNHMVLSRSCTIEMWVNDTGMMVCRIYKAMAAFLIISWISAGCSAVLDWTVLAGQRTRGAYAKMQDNKGSRQKGTYRELNLGRNADISEGTPSLAPSSYENTPKIG